MDLRHPCTVPDPDPYDDLDHDDGPARPRLATGTRYTKWGAGARLKRPGLASQGLARPSISNYFQFSAQRARAWLTRTLARLSISKYY